MRQAKTSRIFRICLIVAAACLLAALVWVVFLRPTRILVVNATLAQQADVALNNDSRRIRLKFADAAQLAADGKPLRGTDAVVIFSRGLYLEHIRYSLHHAPVDIMKKKQEYAAGKD